MTRHSIESPAFYQASGLRFACRRCSSCCRHTPGFVFLSRNDLSALLAATGSDLNTFKHLYLRAVRTGFFIHLCLKEKANYDCIFWENGGCAVYAARPLQCQSYPFWSSLLETEEVWNAQGRHCPGIGNGVLHPGPEIDDWLRTRRAEGLIELKDDDLDHLVPAAVFGPAGER
jgi:uncharacterized protein